MTDIITQKWYIKRNRISTAIAVPFDVLYMPAICFEGLGLEMKCKLKYVECRRGCRLKSSSYENLWFNQEDYEQKPFVIYSAKLKLGRFWSAVLVRMCTRESECKYILMSRNSTTLIGIIHLHWEVFIVWRIQHPNCLLHFSICAKTVVYIVKYLF